MRYQKLPDSVSVRLERDAWRDVKMYAASKELKVGDAVSKLVRRGFEKEKARRTTN